MKERLSLPVEECTAHISVTAFLLADATPPTSVPSLLGDE